MHNRDKIKDLCNTSKSDYLSTMCSEIILTKCTVFSRLNAGPRINAGSTGLSLNKLLMTRPNGLMGTCIIKFAYLK